MKLQLLIFGLSTLLLTGCFGDKRTVNVKEIGDTSFVNKSFKGNLINYADGMPACDKLNESTLASIYNVAADLIIIDSPQKNPQRQSSNSSPVCSFYVKSGGSDFEWLRGSISVNREIGKDEMMGEIAEAAGGGENWKEAWALKKSISKSAEWVDGMGQAALWYPAHARLEIKFDGYILSVFPPKNKLNQAEQAKNRDYKKAAIQMAKAAGYIR